MKLLSKILICLLATFILASCYPDVIVDNNMNSTINFAYSTQSTVLHKISCGETKHIKRENYAETNEMLCDLFNKGFRLCKVCFRSYDKKFTGIEYITRFQQCLKKEFNFLPFNEEKKMRY